jgi:preprotein translocase subunit SecG
MTFAIYFLTAIMVIDCLFLILLVLVQLPKKEAGMGQAFGGAATDALFGAGSGNVLTKVTKWAAGIFFALAVLLTILGTYKTTGGGTSRFQQLLGETKSSSLPTAPQLTNQGETKAPPAGTPLTLNLPTNAPSTNPAAAITNK